MVLFISQETFNQAVKENIDDLGMTPEEALDEAVKQFEAQGVDLSHIVKELMTNHSSLQVLDDIVKKLADKSSSKASPEIIVNQLQLLTEECNKGIEYRINAGKAGAYDVLLNTYQKYEDKTVHTNCMKALISLMTQQPDLLDDRGVDMILFNVKDSSVCFELKRLSLRWAKECCVMHEVNRQKIFDRQILDGLKELLIDGASTDILRDVMSVCRALVLDDDVRVEFGRAHEHARIIASETLCIFTALMIRFKTDENLIHDLMLTITALLVRTEFCKKVEDADGLEMIKHVMENFNSSTKIIRQCFKLLKALAGNDECKVNIIRKNLANTITCALDTNKENASTATAGLSCISALTLRCPDNSEALFNTALPEVIVNIMKAHPEQKQVQKVAAWAIRNMVSRSRYQSPTFIRLGVEDLLYKDLKKFKEIEYDIKAALRDLGSKVELKEEWTGKGGALTNRPLQH